MNIDVDGGLKIFAAFFGAGGGFAFFRPFAARLFTLWLDRVERRQKAEEARANADLEKERALERIATADERLTGVLEQMLEWMKRIDARHDRQEARQTVVEVHLGIPQTASALPPQPPPVAPPPPVRTRQATDPAIQAEPRPAMPSSPAGAHG